MVNLIVPTSQNRVVELDKKSLIGPKPMGIGHGLIKLTPSKETPQAIWVLDRGEDPPAKASSLIAPKNWSGPSHSPQVGPSNEDWIF